MRILNKYVSLFIFAFAMVFSNTISAQILGGTVGNTAPKVPSVAKSPSSAPVAAKETHQEVVITIESDSMVEINEPFFIPEGELTPFEKRPTLDGVKRGPTSFVPFLSDDPNATKDDELIFLYYKDFSVEKMMSGKVNCNVTFVVTTTLRRRLNNLSVRLVWPNMNTAISFDDINPNTETHYPYTLMGEGCFSMDKTPNIVVNRCRVKDVSQSNCAAKIRWISKK